MSVKTPVTILQELTVKNNTFPHYEYIDQSSNTYFQCKVTALDVEAIGDGRCKKDAKQQSARLLLKKLAEMGKYFPTGSDNLTVPNSTPQDQDILLTSVSKLTDFCTSFHIPPPEFNLLTDTGPAHAKQFTMQCKVGGIERVATALSKKQAKQLAASIILEYFKNNMEDKVLEFDSQEVNQNNAAADKFCELSEAPWRPNLGFIIANYHYGLKEIEETLLKEAKEFLSSITSSPDPSDIDVQNVEKILNLLKLEYEWESMESISGNCIMILKVPHSIPPIFIDGVSSSVLKAKVNAAHKAIIYIKQMLSFT